MSAPSTRCPCGCKTNTTRLFAPGHDMRYRRMIREASASRSQRVLWDTRRIPVAQAIERIAELIGSDWSAVPDQGATQIKRAS